MGVMEMNRTKCAVKIASPESLRETLGGFERTYNLSSEEFLRQWEAGVLDDRQDYFRGYGTCYLAMSMGVLPKPRAGWHANG